MAVLLLSGALLYRRIFVRQTERVAVDGPKRKKTTALSDDAALKEAGKVIGWTTSHSPSHAVVAPLAYAQYGAGACLDRGSGFVASSVPAPHGREARKEDKGRRDRV